VFPSLVMTHLAVPLIWGTVFIVKIELSLNVRDSCFNFCFTPNLQLSLLSILCSSIRFQTVTIEEKPTDVGPDVCSLV
jgi:hypothetical protein